MIFRKRPKALPSEPSQPRALDVPGPGERLPPSELAAARKTLKEGRAFAPHCDARILHEPGSCWSCDLYPDWQVLRKLWGIAFTGQKPKIEQHGEGDYTFTTRELPCPADFNRPPDDPSDHRQWGPNRAQGKDRG